MKFNRSWIVVLCLYLILLSLLSLAVYIKIIPSSVTKITPVDLIGHFILIGLVSYIAHLSTRKSKLRFLQMSLPIAPIIILFFCSTDEIIEKFIWHSGIDKKDIIADFCGILFFTWLAERTHLKMKK
ncbi:MULTISPECIES: VanZ family protein [Nostocales]|uniref:VanZ family protein n=3 Tax=Nostocales TaxID=1161 RepID=A0A0C1N6V6_9CYAN|nr:VanZ family protein [Tolypothrix bouteillei]KAF3885836.1 VanZ family protein [Tolypothrix bouteillei VB521301]